ncbi:hypothetical protein Aab01nite_27470 [Paractinoplanes abujensis]|uniref:TraD/TraG TraM recognition site domain-containing protein n=1 Tax=Paractinoplanes abujensis TaxID=882441 RepID=A0A7W7D3K5_9ACTN|nr:DUF2267 domain-containing protein [Actinoplanes abujensis]MBB4698358.1 hypothetical protein [Actinoplanes abujensis]GID19157.1 hypothetical protein Aab01nite_27470 [Actinoplanes abujensis]
MTVAPHDIPFVLLATTGERLGWIYADRDHAPQPFGEPGPEPTPVSPGLQEFLRRAVRSKARWRRSSIRIGIALGFACFGYGIWRIHLDGGFNPLFGTLAKISFCGGLGGAILTTIGPWLIRRAITVTEAGHAARHRAAVAQWEARRDDHEEQQRIAAGGRHEWVAAAPSPGHRRVDIIGGTMFGWEAVVTVYGASLLATRGAMTLVDFTGDGVCAELMRLATATERSVRRLHLPADLAEFDLLAGLSPGELVDCLVEAMHGDGRGGRADRSEDWLLLTEICEVLGERPSLARLLAALRTLTDRRSQDVLSSDEIERLLDQHPDENRRQLYPQLRRIEAFLHPLAAMGSAAQAVEPASLTCLITGSDGGDAQNDLLRDLILHWLTRLVRRRLRPMGSLVVLGADEVDHRAIEKLSTLCERNGVRLVLFFAHLRAEALHTIGGGEVALMRLGNHHEASQAADYIGKGHKFVLSQLTRTLGGSDTHTLSDTSGQSSTDGGSGTMSFGNRRTRGRAYGKTWNLTRNWSQTVATARGQNWSDASSVQRTYEYTVEPRALQDLPEYAMVHVRSEGRETTIQAVEVDPAIVMLPHVSMYPRPDAAVRTKQQVTEGAHSAEPSRGPWGGRS